MTALPTYAIICCGAVLLIALMWFLRDSLTQETYERQTASGHYSDHVSTIDDLPDKIGLSQLIVKCRKCGEFYSSGMVSASEIYQRHLGNVTTTCPFCKHQNVTNPRSMTPTLS